MQINRLPRVQNMSDFIDRIWKYRFNAGTLPITLGPSPMKKADSSFDVRILNIGTDFMKSFLPMTSLAIWRKRHPLPRRRRGRRSRRMPLPTAAVSRCPLLTRFRARRAYRYNFMNFLGEIQRAGRKLREESP